MELDKPNLIGSLYRIQFWILSEKSKKSNIIKIMSSATSLGLLSVVGPLESVSPFPP